MEGDDQLRNLTLQDQDELLAINDIGDYWPEKPLKKNIHVLVEPPETTATSSREQELLDRIASLEESLNKSEYVFDVIVSPKRTNGFKWNVDVRDATLEGLKEYIRKEYEPPSLEKDGAVLKFISGDKERYSPQNDQECSGYIRIKEQFQVNRCHRNSIKSYLGLVVRSVPALRAWRIR